MSSQKNLERAAQEKGWDFQRYGNYDWCFMLYSPTTPGRRIQVNLDRGGRVFRAWLMLQPDRGGPITTRRILGGVAGIVREMQS